MKALLVAAVLAGCTVGDSTGGTPTNGPSSPDAGTSSSGSNQNGNNNGSNTGSNTGSNLPACTGALYDPCTDNTQCMSQNCKAFGGAGIEVCTTTCTPGDNTPCGAGTCNNMGICKPPAANACTR